MEPRSIAPDARAAVFAAVCTLLAVAAHIPMSGSGVPTAAVAFGAATVFCFARMAATLGERGLVSIGLLVSGSQFGLHLLFEAAQAPVASTAGVPAMSGMANMSGLSASPLGSAPMGLTSRMTVAHLLAAIMTAWWLRRGEAALFALARQARAELSTSWRMLASWADDALPTPLMHGVIPRRGSRSRQSYEARVLLFIVIRRGPPPALCW